MNKKELKEILLDYFRQNIYPRPSCFESDCETHAEMLTRLIMIEEA